jgi:hypothetical protein
VITVSTAIEIAAPPAAVWPVLTDLEHYPEWNLPIRSLRGECREGCKLILRLKVGPFTYPLKVRILVLEPERQLRWSGVLGAAWIFKGEHCFAIKPLREGKVRFTQYETYTGVLAALVRPALPFVIRRTFMHADRALKRRVEGAAAVPMAELAFGVDKG